MLSFYLIFRSTPVQTTLARLTADYFSKKLNTSITIRGFDLSFKRGLVIEDIGIKDHKNTDLFVAHELSVMLKKLNLKKRIIHIKRVFIDNGTIQLITHRGDSTLNLQHLIDRFASPGAAEIKDTTPSPGWEISSDGIDIRDTRFHFQDENEPLAEAGMDYTNIDVSGIDLDLTDLRFNGDTILANIRKLSAKERSGFVLRSLIGEFQVSPAFLKARNLKIQTDHSDLALDFDFSYRNWSGYNEFIDSVTIQTKIEPSYLDLQDIGFFAPELLVMKDRIRISGDIKGTVSNFKAKNFRFAYGENTYFYGNVSAFGLPDVEETFIDLNIKAMSTNTTDIESFQIPTDTRTIVLPEVLGNIGVVGIQGNFTGFYNDFVATARFRTDLGNITTDLTLRREKDSPLISYQGQLDVGSFDLGRMVDDTVSFGKISLRGDIDGKGFSMEDARLKMNLRVDSAWIYHYNYTNLDIAGSLTEKRFNGSLRTRDPNLDLDFDGLIDLGDSIPKFDFDADIRTAKLFNLHLLSRDSITDISTRMKVDLTGNNLDNMDGSIRLENTVYREGAKEITMDYCSLVSEHDKESNKSYRLQSDFIDADINGAFYFKDLVPSLSTFIQNYLASFNLMDSLLKNHPMSNQEMNYYIKFKNTNELTDVFIPFLRIAKNSILIGYYNEEHGTLTMKGESDSITVFGIELSNWFLDAKTVHDNLSFQTGCGELFLTKQDKKDTLTLKLDNFLLSSVIHQDTVNYEFSWVESDQSSEFDGFASFRYSPAIELKFKNFSIALDNKKWSINPENSILIDTSFIQLDHVDFLSENQYLKVNGVISHDAGDTLNVEFNQVDVSNVDKFFGSSDINLDGNMSGIVSLTGIYDDISILTDLRIEEFKFNHELLGDATLKVNYDAAGSRFDIHSQILYTGNIGTSIPFSLEGSYFLDKSDPRLDFTIALKNLNLRMLRPFVSSFMSGLNGMVSGNVRIKGNPERPVIKGQLSLMRTEFKINYLNVLYSLADVVTIDSSAFIFNQISVFDSLGHKSVLNGKITHHNFGDFRLGLNIAMTDFSAFNNTRLQNPVFYGQARGSGTVSITGPIDNIAIDVKARTGGNTRVVIPISTTESIGENDFIFFVNPVTDSTGIMTRKLNKPATGISLNIGLYVNPDAEVEVSLPSHMGNLKASGTGNLQMNMEPTKPFNMSGTYSLTKGSFLFQIKNLLRIPMSIKEGSQVSWSGDPGDASVSVSASYKTKAPLKGLTTNPEEEGIRIPVECIIRLSGKLLNLDMSFGISLPNVEESIRTAVFSAIDTNNPTTMAEQVIYLMVMNQFQPVVGTTGPAVDVGATSIAIVNNQINGWLSQISQNVNVGVNYRPSTSTTEQEFDVAVSTQLLDDRLLIDGTFGMNSYKSSFQQSNTIVGDINIEYILTKNRRWRVHAYNRTNTLTILNNNSPYTQGVGVTYQRDFTSFKDLFSRKKKEIKSD